ncbi:MAG: hypothetical protein QXU67_04970 [Candidatus Bathyarchaeia archaeon]
MHEKTNNKPKNSGDVARNEKAISPVIAAVILSSVLLVILIVATFVANNILELRVQNTEFEQAKTNMLLLHEIIEEAGLRHSSGSYAQFNLRSGAIDIVENNPDNLTVLVNGTQIINSETLSIIYRAGRLVSSIPTSLRGNSSLIVKGAASSLGYLRIETEGGVKIKLDYNRIRIMESETTEYNLVEILIFEIERGSIGGSGTLRIKAQNKGIFIESYTYYSKTVAIKVQVGSQTEEYNYSGNLENTVVAVIKSVIEVSAWGD